MRKSLTETMAVDRELINAELDAALTFGRDVPTRLSRAMRYAALGPGKRIRPILALEAFRAAGGRGARPVLPFCCGIEMIHTFSLVHDDLPSMDDDDFRRGRPSLHREFDEATAILAADALFSRAFELFAAAPAEDRRKIEAIGVISRAVGPQGMTGGQILDVAPDMRMSSRRLNHLHRKKTAEFIAASLVAGAGLGGSRTRERHLLWQAGIWLGMLFQTTDDLLDEGYASDEGRLTALSLDGREKAERRARAQAKLAGRAFRAVGPDYHMLAELPGIILSRRS